MAYVDADTSSRKLTAGIAVFAAEAGLAWVIIAALTFSATHKFENPFTAIKITPDQTKKPPPPPTDPKIDPIVAPPVVPKPLVTLAPADPGQKPFVDTTDGTVGGTDVGTVTFPKVEPEPLPSPKPLYAPKKAKPRGDSSRWLSTDDYPRRGLLDMHEGQVGYRLTIDNAGKVTNCMVTASSGFAELDQTTCQLLPRRAKFEAARDENGNAAAGSYNGTVTWRLPPEE